MPPSAEELQEIEELKAMIKGTPERPSAIPFGAVSRFMVGEENRAHADAARKEKEERDALKAELAQQRMAHAEKIKEQARERKAAEKVARETDQAKREEEARKLRAKGAKLKAQGEKRRNEEWEVAQKRVQDENEAWKRMNAAEAAQDKVEREEGTRDRKAVEAAFRKEREETLAEKRAQVAKVKKMTDQSVVEEALAWAAQKREQAAAARREQRAALVDARKRGKDEFVSMAQGVKGQVNAMKENVKAVHGQVLKQKKDHAAKERDNDYLVQQEKIRVLASKKQQHQNVYHKKYAPVEMAQSWVGATTLRRGGKVKDGMSPEK